MLLNDGVKANMCADVLVQRVVFSSEAWALWVVSGGGNRGIVARN